jgi:HTH-type transcriptional repressor of NAD biosynthesis genes
VCVDLDRERFPISGSDLRADLGAHWDLLTAPAKAHYARRVRIVGVDSSGKTTLARALAEHHQTAWVPEFGRHYWEGRQHVRGAEAWTRGEFVTIAQGQVAWEDGLALRANRLLICDTDPHTTHVWQRRNLGRYNDEVEAVADARTYALTLLTTPDFEFVQDGTRDDDPQARARMHQWLLEELDRKGSRAVVLSGPPEKRLADANAAIAPLLEFDPLPAP